MKTALSYIERKLAIRKEEKSFRQLRQVDGLLDFSSNDYLGFARCPQLKRKIGTDLEKYKDTRLGATGSRLLTGNSALAEQMEIEIAAYHRAKNGLIFNSGYTANTALFSCLPQRNDTIIYDELIHASVIDGARLSFANRFKFKHNDLEDLEKKLRQYTGVCYVAVESVYSMDGDLAELKAIAELCRTYGANLIVDEAHAFGILGTGLTDELQIQDLVFARIITFGKALGLHGAIILGPDLLRDYLINFARPFIYSTATPEGSLIALRRAYCHFFEQPDLKFRLAEKSALFLKNMPPQQVLQSTNNPTAIQAVFVKGNPAVKAMGVYLESKGFDVRPILSPTVAKGSERLRITLHLHNSDQQILDLCSEFHHLSQIMYL